MAVSDTNRPKNEEEGFGCKPAAQAFGLIAVFAVLAAVVGVSLALGDACSGPCETLGFALYAAGLPVSGAFAAVAGELPIAWPLDVTVWLIVSAAASRVAERLQLSIVAVAVRVVLLALAYGFVASLFIEAVDL